MIIHSLNSLWGRKRSLHSPACRLLPDLHLGKKFTLSLLNLATSCSAVSGVISLWFGLTLCTLGLSLSATLFRLSLSPLHPQPSSLPGVSSFSHSLSHHNPAPARWFIGMSCTRFPTLEILSFSQLGFNFYEMYVMICSGWLSRRRFCWVKLRVWFSINLPCLSLFHFLKVSWAHISRDLKVTTSEFTQNSGHRPQIEVDLLASVVFPLLKSI